MLFEVFRDMSDTGSSDKLAESMKALEIMIEKAVIMLPYVDNSDSSSDESSLSAGPLLEEETNRYGRLQCYVTCLMDLSLAIERQNASIQALLNQRAVPPDTDFPVSQNAQPFAIRIRDRYVKGEISGLES
jgi:hypothetical protein